MSNAWPTKPPRLVPAMSRGGSALSQQFVLGRVDYHWNSDRANEEGFPLHRQELVFGFFGSSPTVEDVMTTYTGKTPITPVNFEHDTWISVPMMAALIKYLQHLDTEGDTTLHNLLEALGIASSWISFRDDKTNQRSIIYRKVYFK